MTTTIDAPPARPVAATGGNNMPAPPPAPQTAHGLAIQTHGLTKEYGGRRAVDNADLEVPAGAITGFVGPNGAGKTTTIRMLLGLIRPSAGGGEVLGADISHPERYLANVGALIEGPAFYPTLTGRRNLEVLATLGGYPRGRVDEVLEAVELTDRARDLFRTYSMGMKQRLGVAAALLPRPRLLMLDEPTNGLDPGGIIETRVLMRGLRDQGITVFVSSHLLSELEQVAEHIVLVQQGRILFQGPIADLLARRRSGLRLAGSGPGDLEVIAAVARRLGADATVGDGHVRVDGGTDLAGPLNRAAMSAGVVLTELSVERSTLEETFLDMTGGH